ncbi:NAD(P)/FAD-dependent oxidoreductase [Litoreibacter albidus]|uniref:NAD(P)/FAD-dependent oxidoreductase n=1 Tax=Litoreibacter albidus TaxID=670155 RepID=UPI00373612FA
MRLAVIGRGLWGAAAARHLAMAGADVTLIGPTEPADKATHNGVFGSHYDEGRITRKNALDPYWVGVSTAAIDRYHEIERQSGVRFYTPTGAAMVGGAAFMARVEVGRALHDVPCDMLDHAALTARFPFFTFPADFTGYHETTRAGHVSPRNLVAAQAKAAQGFGATLLEATVDGLEERAQDVVVVTDQGRHSFDRVLVAAGYNTDRVLGRAPSLEVYARTVAFFEVDEAQGAALSAMPTLVYDTPEDPYLLPPIRYPDGKLYLKLGGDPTDEPLTTDADVRAWFQAGGNPQVRDRLDAMLRRLMPALDIKSLSMGSCVTSWTKDRRPELARLSDRVAVCTGGNGAGAKCSDEIGRLGAALIHDKTGDDR